MHRHSSFTVTMEPFDMVLYESGSLIHSRPFPLQGRFMANVFIHFEITGRKIGDTSLDYLDTLDDFYPPYLLPDTPWRDEWAKQNRNGWHKPSPSAARQGSGRAGHHAAALGDVQTLHALAKTDRRALHRRDENGWAPIHEAARAGHTDVLRFLVERFGAEKNAQTGGGQTPLNLVLTFFDAQHPAAQYLYSIGAQEEL